MIPMNHTAAARKVLRELDAELAASGKRTGQELVWDASDRIVLELIAAAPSVQRLGNRRHG